MKDAAKELGRELQVDLSNQLLRCHLHTHRFRFRFSGVTSSESSRLCLAAFSISVTNLGLYNFLSCKSSRVM